jgi:hypothetical protein
MRPALPAPDMPERRPPAAAAPSLPGDSQEQAALLGALQAVLAPLARLALARGLPYATLDELLKQALVDQADQAHADTLAHRRVSRVSTATGIHRREVSRLIQLLRDGRQGQPRDRRSLPQELVAHWLTAPRFRARRGAPRALPRQAPADGGPSFDELAQAVTRDVHSRSLLDELLRQGLVQVAEDGTVRLAPDAEVPRGDRARLLRVLGTNVGAHLQAAVDNVQAPGDAPHLERAVFAHGLSERSIDELRTLVELQWQALVQAVVPAVQALVARDQDQPGADRRMRLGLYHHVAADPSPSDAPLAATPARTRKSRS